MNTTDESKAVALQETIRSRLEAHQREAASIRSDAMEGALALGGSLRAVDIEFDTPGRYTGLSSQQLASMGYPVPPRELLLPVPPECPAWLDAELDPRDQVVMRFFVREAWLELPQARGGCLLLVNYAVNGEAMDSLRVTVDDVAVSMENATTDEHGRRVVALPEGGRILRLMTPVVEVPATIHEGSTDVRRLSAAISIVTKVEGSK